MTDPFRPVWAGGWIAARWIFACGAAWGHLRRVLAIHDVYGAQDMVFAEGIFHLADYVRFTPTTAFLVWTVGTVGIAMVAVGGRWLRPGLLLWLVGAWSLLGVESMNVKAHDRLLTYVAVALFVSPASERGLTTRWRSPAARWYLLVVFVAIYTSTGALKWREGPIWRNGEAMQWILVHPYHAGNAVSTWVSGQRWLCTILGWWTLVFELSFPVLVWFRRTNPPLLALGALFHVGIFALMDVGAFSLVSLSAYPVLLHPDVARGLWQRVAQRFRYVDQSMP